VRWEEESRQSAAGSGCPVKLRMRTLGIDAQDDSGVMQRFQELRRRNQAAPTALPPPPPPWSALPDPSKLCDVITLDDLDDGGLVFGTAGVIYSADEPSTDVLADMLMEEGQPLSDGEAWQYPATLPVDAMGVVMETQTQTEPGLRQSMTCAAAADAQVAASAAAQQQQIRLAGLHGVPRTKMIQAVVEQQQQQQQQQEECDLCELMDGPEEPWPATA
jgi:hypothetical protein